MTRMSTAVALAATVVAFAGGMTACDSEETTPSRADSPEHAPRSETEPPARWTTFRDPVHGLTVSYPPGWQRAEKTLTPRLGDPEEILSLGTYQLRPGGERCAHMPVTALEDLGAEDAFVSVQERSPPYPSEGYPPRSTPFTPTLHEGGGEFCVPDPGRLAAWVSFSDARRAFYVLIAVGPSASDDTRAEVYEILESLRFDDRPAADGAGTTRARPACLPAGDGHERICGVVPPRHEVEAGTGLMVATVAGERFWVVLPSELAPGNDVVATPSVPVGVQAGLTTASPRAAANGYCADFAACEPVAVERATLPTGGVVARWDDASGTIRNLEVTTVDLGRWTLVLSEPSAARAERIARALRWSLGGDGYPRLASADDAVPLSYDWAGVQLWVPDVEKPGERHGIYVVPGCELSAKEPDLGGEDVGPDLQVNESGETAGGSWCVDGRFWVDVASVDRPQLARLHEKLRIVPSLD
jgi:hypothetical protein